MTNNSGNIKDTSGLYRKSIRGGAWLFALRIFTQLLSMAALVILYRLLDPKDFGLLGIGTLTMGMLMSLTEIGFREALIQREDAEQYLDVAWTFKIVRGFAIFLVVYMIAPYIAEFFARPDAIGIIRVVSITLIFESVSNIGTVYFAKNIEFHKQFIQQIAGTVVWAIVTIILAFMYKNVWALVLGRLSGSLTRCIISYLIHPYRPKLSFDFSKVKKLWKFGKYIFVSKILVYLCHHGDDILLGKVLGVTALGYYQQAFKMGNIVTNEIGNKIATVSFATYSKLQDNLGKIRGGFFKSLQVSSLIVFPITGGIIILAPEFIRLILGQKWMPMLSAMQILSIAGAMKCLQAGSVFMALGRPDVSAKRTMVRFIIIAATIYPLTVKFGIAGTSFCVLLPAFVLVPVIFYQLKKLIDIKISKIVKYLFFPTLATLIMMLAVFVAKKYIADIGLTVLGLLLCLAAMIYCISILIISRFDKEYDVIALVRNVIKGAM
jgi:O-antigen/teichoic acid export membrane protein